MTSAFIIQVQPQLQSDPNEETAALLRVLIHKIDNTTFDDNVPPIPEWSGPPHIIVQVQAILYASLAASLFSAFLAMLGKQWLNRYASINMRGSAIERSQNRQRKLDRIVTWYFEYLMELLPLMLQFALLLLGCALSRYLWEIDTTVASVILGVTSFGVASYTFFTVAGATSLGCPYQTPGTNILRSIPPLALSALHSAFSHSVVIYGLASWWYLIVRDPDPSTTVSVLQAILIIVISPVVVLWNLVHDAGSPLRVAVGALVVNARRVRGWFHRAWGWNTQTAALDLPCITWMLQTSSDKTIRLPTLRLLAMMTTLTNFDPALISVCLDILVGCVSIVDGKVVILPGSEELAALSALYCLCTLAHLRIVDSASSVFEDMRQRYTETFPVETDFEGIPTSKYRHHFCIIHNIFYSSSIVHSGYYSISKRVWSQNFRRPRIQWENCQLSGVEDVVLFQVAAFQYQEERRQEVPLMLTHQFYEEKRPKKVPRWILRFAHHLLSQEPLPPASAVANCLTIIAMDLGCTGPSEINPDERYVHIRRIFTLLTEIQWTAGRGFNLDNRGTRKHGSGWASG